MNIIKEMTVEIDDRNFKFSLKGSNEEFRRRRSLIFLKSASHDEEQDVSGTFTY
jgi:hypothetical protein